MTEELSGNPADVLAAMPHAHGEPVVQARFKAHPEDFVVEEELGWLPSGEGEHLCLHVCKRGITTTEAARRLAGFVGIPLRDISYSGLKDRQAVTRQWFSLQLPGRADPDLSSLNDESLRIEVQQRNHRKIRRGVHRANRFHIRLRDTQEVTEEVDQRIERIARFGVPNYFGEQRFGHNAGNVLRAVQWFSGELRPRGRAERSILLSSARSFLFNCVLAERIRGDSWDNVLPGDVMLLAGSNSVFPADADDPAIPERLRDLDIHPTGPLWGRGPLPGSAGVALLETAVAQQWSSLSAGLEARGLKQERRSLRLCPEQLHYARPDVSTLELSFTLPPGAYATSVLRELYTGIDSGE